jgi:membrane protein YqaA with SNARE-associated domain
VKSIKPEHRRAFLRLLVLLGVIASSIFIYAIRDRVRNIAGYGYPGVFLVSFLANATIFIPAPSQVVVFTMGAVLNPIGVALSAGAGAGIGELTGYLAGFSGETVVERVDLFLRVKTWLNRHRRFYALIIFLLAAVPNPFFDLAGIAAGAIRIPVGNFLIVCILGKIVHMLFFAFLGASSLPRIFGP